MVEQIETRKREFSYKGKTLEELQKLDVREFAKITHSRARRTILKQFQEIEKFINRSREKIARKKQVKTHDRYLIIVPQMIGMKIHVYKGNSFVPVEVTGEMLGHSLGEFALTRAKIKHGSAGVGATKGSRALSKK